MLALTKWWHFLKVPIRNKVTHIVIKFRKVKNWGVTQAPFLCLYVIIVHPSHWYAFVSMPSCRCITIESSITHCKASTSFSSSTTFLYFSIFCSFFLLNYLSLIYKKLHQTRRGTCHLNVQRIYRWKNAISNCNDKLLTKISINNTNYNLLTNLTNEFYYQ